jgi:hypothetical protein
MASSLFDTCTRISSSLRNSAVNRIKAISIARGKRYHRIRPPAPHVAFVKAIWEPGSPIVGLLNTNAGAAEDTERLLRHEIRLFSSRFTFTERSIPWHEDILSGYSYPALPHPIIHVEPDRGHDIIVPWELSRLQFIPTLIQAHRMRRNEDVRILFKAIVDDWIVKNPYRVGVNWMTGMDVALRAINLALGLSYFGMLGGGEDWYRKVLWSHAEYLNDEDLRNPPPMRNNHFMISVVGSLMLSLLFTGRDADRLFERATTCLDSEILRQFREDGGNFESAVHYHQLTLEAVLVALCFLRTAEPTGRFGTARTRWISSEAEARIERGINLVSDYMSTFGRSPQFGDSSDTRVLIHRDYFNWNPLDHSFIADLSRVALTGKRCFADTLYHTVYPRSGYGFFSTKRYGVCCNASPVVEDDHGGHNHCDKTSFVLRVRDTPVFIDVGTYCYTPEVRQRHEHRRTRSHNLVLIDECEQAPLNPEEVFQTPRGIAPSIRHEAERAPETWIMRHHGYSRIPGIGTVTRTVRCLEGRIEIEEQVEGAGEHAIDIVYHLHPDIECRRENGVVLLAKNGSPLCFLEIPKDFKLIETAGLYSPAYREHQSATMLVLSNRAALPVGISYSIIVSE